MRSMTREKLKPAAQTLVEHKWSLHVSLTAFTERWYEIQGNLI